MGTSLSAAFVTSLGIATIREFASWGQRNTVYFMCFAAGILISACFLHIIPKSFEMARNALIWLVVGFLGPCLFNRFVTAFVCERDMGMRDYAIGVVPMLGIGFHSFIDSFVYSIAFSVSIFTGFLATLGRVLHEFPEGIITYLLLVRSGFTQRNVTLCAFLAAAATTLLGTFVWYPIISEIGYQTLGSLLSLSAGVLIYAGATHLLPRAEQECG